VQRFGDSDSDSNGDGDPDRDCARGAGQAWQLTQRLTQQCF